MVRLRQPHPLLQTAESRIAIDKALRCDLGKLHGVPLAGIQCLKTIVSTEKATTLRLPINLLGIYGFTIVDGNRPVDAVNTELQQKIGGVLEMK